MRSSSQMITANKPTSSFLQAGCPSCRPTNSVRATKNHIHELWASTGRLPASCEVSWLPWGRLPKPLISPQTPVPQQRITVQYCTIWMFNNCSILPLLSSLLTLLTSYCTCSEPDRCHRTERQQCLHIQSAQFTSVFSNFTQLIWT